MSWRGTVAKMTQLYCLLSVCIDAISLSVNKEFTYLLTAMLKKTKTAIVPFSTPASRGLAPYSTTDDIVILPCQSPAAGPVWPPPGPAVAPAAPRSPAPGDSSSFPRCPAGCGDGWTRPSPPERVKNEERRKKRLVQCIWQLISHSAFVVAF